MKPESSSLEKIETVHNHKFVYSDIGCVDQLILEHPDIRPTHAESCIQPSYIDLWQ